MRIKECSCPDNLPALGIPLEYQSQTDAHGQRAPAHVWTGEVMVKGTPLSKEDSSPPAHSTPHEVLPLEEITELPGIQEGR
eukprot:10639775-Karenia_brevis.AAC.1